jgi:hypothetical protein
MKVGGRSRANAGPLSSASLMASSISLSASSAREATIVAFTMPTCEIADPLHISQHSPSKRHLDQ